MRVLIAGVLGVGAATSVGVLLRAALGPLDLAAMLILLCYLGVAPWLGLCAANGWIGFAVLVLARDPARAVLPGPAPDTGAASDAVIPTALALAVRHEDLGPILDGMRPLLDGLVGQGAFALFVLSDSDADRDEPATVAAFASGYPGQVHYRRRIDNAGFKAGNVMDFLDRHAEAWPLAIVLDADSRMTAPAVRRLVAIMQASPRLAIVQHLTVGLPAETAFTRLFQFGMRAGMRVWATGQAWWQGGSGPYWGHNAIIRTVAFRDHARLPLLGGRPILSHDQVEAAMLAASGWGVAVWADEAGSFEQNPPTLRDFIVRDARWQAGNLQYVRLLGRPRLRPMGRWQLLQAILLFAGAPLYAAMFLLAMARAAAPTGATLRLAAIWSLVLYGPKLLGYVQVMMSARQRRRYGGGPRFAAGAVAEMAFTLLLDAPMTLTKAWGLARVVAGRPAGWSAQNRDPRRLRWGEAAAMFWPHTLLGIACFGWLGHVSWAAAALAFPFAGGLVVAIPLAVVTAGPPALRWMGRIAMTPDELEASREIARGPP